MNKNDINTIKYVYDDLKKLILSCVIKYDNIGRKNETAESKRNFDYYYIAVNKVDTFDSYRSFPEEVLVRAGINDRNLLLDCMDDKFLIPFEYKSKVLEENRKYIIENFEETNNYYRMLLGLPDTDDHDYIYLDKETCKKYKVREEIPIHKYDDYEINNLSQIIPNIKKNYPDKKYLDYLGSNKVNLMRARTAKNFDIIRIDLNFHQVLLKSFINTYEMAREYFTSVIYIKEKNTKDELYDNFIALNIMFMTIQRMFVNTFKIGVERDFYDIDSIKKVFKAYGIPFFETLPVDYQRLIMKKLNILLRAKSTDKCLYDIVDILLPNRAKLYEYFLMKEQKYDENDIPMEVYKEVEDIDENIVYREDAFNMYDIYFQTVDIKEVGVNMSLENRPNRQDYFDVIEDDSQWWHDDDLIQELDEREFNYIETKYLGINVMYHLTQMMFESVYFVNMLADKKNDYHRPQDGFYLTINLSRISNRPVSIFDSVILLCALMCKKRNFTGNIINSGTKILSVMGFDFKENFANIREDIKKNHRIIDQKILNFLDLTRIESKEDINTLYNNMVQLAEFCVEGMNSTDDVKVYHAYKYLYDALMIKKYNTDILVKSDGNVASTYLDYLEDQNPELANFVHNCTSRECGIYIEHILGTLNELIPDLEYLTTINGTDNVLVEALVKLILFFKSYTVDLKDINVLYIMDSRRYNMIKLVKDLTMIIEMHPKERLAYYIDSINQLKLEIFYDEFIEPLEQIVLYAKSLKKDKILIDNVDRILKIANMIYQEVLFIVYSDIINNISSVKETKEKQIILEMTSFYLSIISDLKINYDESFKNISVLNIKSILNMKYSDDVDFIKSIKKIIENINLEDLYNIRVNFHNKDKSNFYDKYNINIKYNISEMMKLIYNDIITNIEKKYQYNECLNEVEIYKYETIFFNKDNITYNDSYDLDIISKFNELLNFIYKDNLYSIEKNMCLNDNTNISSIHNFYISQHINYRENIKYNDLYNFDIISKFNELLNFLYKDDLYSIEKNTCLNDNTNIKEKIKIFYE